MFDQSIQRVSIIGTGLLGASLGLALRQLGYAGSIIGVARREETRAEALRIGAISHATDDAAEAAAEGDLVILATPVCTVHRMLGELKDVFKSDAIITDVGSTKGSTVRAAEVLARPEMFIGSHPMAGSESSGPGAARADLFTGKPCILTPSEGADERALDTVRTLWGKLGMRVLEMSAERHDAMVAAVSHVPHAVSVMLMYSAAESGALDAASTGLQSVTRLAAGETQMWADILHDNAEAVLEALQAFGQHQQQLVDLLKAGDHGAIAEWLAGAATQRAAWLESKDSEH